MTLGPISPSISTARTQAGAQLNLFAASLDELEALRMATENRIRAAGEWGPGAVIEVSRMQDLLDGIKELERQAELELKRALRRHPLGPWVRSTTGVGEKQGARLLAAIGDPYWNAAEDRPRRGPAELWAYCGYHTVPGNHPAPDTQRCSEPWTAATRRKGQQANWNSTAKMRAFLVAESCIKQSASPYRPVYDAAREKHREAVHKTVCARCGPAGRPAQPGSPLSAGHQHARALRAVAKALLKDLFLERVRQEVPAPLKLAG